MSQLAERAHHRRTNYETIPSLASPYAEHRAAAIWDKGVYHNGKRTRSTVVEVEVKRWREKVQKELIEPARARLENDGVYKKIVARSNDPSIILAVDDMMEAYALMSLNHNEHEYFSQAILRQEILNVEKRLKSELGGGRVADQLMSQVFIALNNQMSIHNALRAAGPVIEGLADSVDGRPDRHQIDVLTKFATFHAEERVGIRHPVIDRILSPDRLVRATIAGDRGKQAVETVKKAVDDVLVLSRGSMTEERGRLDL